MGERLLDGDVFKPSSIIYDWLGHGIYFWEANPKRGLEFAQEVSRLRPDLSNIRNPFVIGAIIQMGLCLDLTSSAGIDMVRNAYKVSQPWQRKRVRHSP